MPATYSQLLYHIVFSTKLRRPLIEPGIEDEMYRYIRGIVLGQRCVLEAINGMPDHVHLLVSARPSVALSTLVQEIKGGSSRWLNQRGLIRDVFAWQKGYSVFTVSASQATTVRKYIARQKQHHRSRSFIDEMSTLLQRHGVTFDPETFRQ